MAKTKVVGDAIVIVSEVKMEDIQKIRKYAPEKLILWDETGENQLFRIGVTNVPSGMINENGAEFYGTTNDSAKLATITMCKGEDVEGDIREYVADKIGSCLVKLGKLEETIPNTLREIDQQRAFVMAQISVE